MKIKTISYQRVKNLGNYESERLEMSAELFDGEDPEDAAAGLRRVVNWILDSPPPSGNKPTDNPFLPEDF